MKRRKAGNSILLFRVYSLITPVQILTHCYRTNQRGKGLFAPACALTHTLTHTAKRADGNNGTNRPRPHPFWTETCPKALQRNGLTLPKLLVRMRSAVRICPAAPKCVDERCNAENAARKCGVFTYNAPLLE